jgi:hypothetical protein
MTDTTTDYEGVIMRRWNANADAITEARARRTALNVEIKALVAERNKLRPMVRLVERSNGD